MKAHPIADEYPAMTNDEYAALVRDIKINGQRFPIITYEGMILDGRHRYRACIEANKDPVMEEFIGDADAARKQCESMNVHRRHMTPEQRRAIVMRELKENANQSNRAIAKSAGVNHATVAKARSEAEATGEIIQSEKRTGLDGRTVKAKKQAKPEAPEVAATKPAKLPAAVRVEQITNLLNSGSNVSQIAKEISMSVEQVRVLIYKHNINASKHQMGGRGYKSVDPNNVIEATVNTLVGAAQGVRCIRSAEIVIDSALAKQLHNEAVEAMRDIRWLLTIIKEKANV